MLVITTNPREFVSGINNITENQLPYASAQALNECALAFQSDERGVMQEEFIVRRPWVLQGVKINRGDFATKRKLEARVIIDSARDFLGKFERGGFKRPRSGKGISIPTIAARRSERSIVPDRLRPKNLNFKAARGNGGFTILKGDNRTFLIQRPDGSGVILQRKGNKVSVKKRRHGPLMPGQRHDYHLVPLFTLKPSVRIAPQLHWEETARRSFQANFPRAMQKWWDEAVRTMKPVGGGAAQHGQALPAGMAG